MLPHLSDTYNVTSSWLGMLLKLDTESSSFSCRGSACMDRFIDLQTSNPLEIDDRPTVMTDTGHPCVRAVIDEATGEKIIKDTACDQEHFAICEVICDDGRNNCTFISGHFFKSFFKASNKILEP